MRNIYIPAQKTKKLKHHSFQPAVSYSIDEEHGKWSKVISLDQCDRASLSSLFAHINFIRHHLLFPKNHNSSTIVSQCLSIPRHIDLKQSSLSISYKYTPFGSVYDLLQRLNHGLSERFVAAIFARAVLAIDYLHSHHILHRGLCSQHLLLIPDEYGLLNVSLCGLGSATRSNRQYDARRVQRNDLPQIHFAWRGWKTDQMDCHPIAWYSPEMVGQDFTGYSHPVDIYSLGLILGEMITGRTPYSALEPYVIALRKLCGEPEYPEFYQPGTNELLSEGMLETYVACVQRDPNKRPSSAALLNFPWVRWGLESKFQSDDLEREVVVPSQNEDKNN